MSFGGLPLDGSFADTQREFISGGVERPARWIELFAKAGRSRKVDELATARNAVAALSWYYLTHDVLGLDVLGIHEDRLVDNWVDVWLTYLTAGLDR